MGGEREGFKADEQNSGLGSWAGGGTSHWGSSNRRTTLKCNVTTESE